MHAYPQAQWLDVAGDTANCQQVSRYTAQLELISFAKVCCMQTRSTVISLVFRAFLCTEKHHLPAGLQSTGDAARDVDEDDLPIAELTGC